MLLELEKHGIKKGYFIKKKIKNFDKKADEIIPLFDLEAIEFDKTKEHKDLALDLKSADALFFKTGNDLFFIEFKSNIKNYMNSMKIRGKIADSFQLLKNIYTQKDFEFKGKKKYFHNCNKIFIFGHNGCIEQKLLQQFNLNRPRDKNGIENNLKLLLLDMKDVENYINT